MAPKSVTFRRHDHLVSVLFGDLLSHSYNITFSMFSYLVNCCIGYTLVDECTVQSRKATAQLKGQLSYSCSVDEGTVPSARTVDTHVINIHCKRYKNISKMLCW